MKFQLMRPLAILFSASLFILCGCSREDETLFTKGTGDMGNFLVKHALKLGAHSLSTNGLPTIGGEWHYSEDQYGVVFRLPRERFSEVETFLHHAFGTPAQVPTETTTGGKFGWYSPKTIGVALQFGFDQEQTQVIVIRPQPANEILKRIPKAMAEELSAVQNHH
jgi:hypothetical protein